MVNAKISKAASERWLVICDILQKSLSTFRSLMKALRLARKVK